MQRRNFLTTSLAAIASGFIPLAGNAEAKRSANGFIRTNWSRDPFSLGSYSYVAKGARKSHHAVLGEPIEDRLFFAGEATHPDYNSTVHAAYESGVMAAEAIFETDANSIGIIGAGASGIAAAVALVDAGYEVTVVEARDRLGGRIWTDGRLGWPLDLGASWIHGTDDNPIAELAEELDIKTRVTNESYIARGRNGRNIADNDLPKWLDNVISIQHSAGADISEINGRAYWVDTDYEGDEVIFPRGYSQLFKEIPSAIEIQLNRIVKSVTLDANGVSVRDRSNRTSSFDAVIVTLPLGVLKQGAVQFSPELPRSKKSAIEKLGMGTLDKVYLRYDTVFWEKDATWILTPENDLPQGQFNQWFNFYPYIGEPVIMAFNGAQPALDLSSLSDAEIIARAQRTLELAYP